MSAGENTKSFVIPLGGDWRSTLIFFAAAVPLILAGAALLLLVDRKSEWESLHVLALTGGFILSALGVCSLVCAVSSLVTGLRFGHQVTLDAAGAKLGTFLGGERSLRWDAGLQLRLTERASSAPEREATLLSLAIPDSLAGLLREMSAERDSAVIRGLRLDGPGLQARYEPLPLTMLSLVRWLMCRALEKVIVERGGAVTWEDDGLSAVQLAGVPITDDEFAPLGEQLAGIPQLRHLNVSDTKLTNASLPLIKSFRSLQSIEAHGTHLDAGAIRAIIQAFESKTSAVPQNFDLLNR